MPVTMGITKRINSLFSSINELSHDQKVESIRKWPRVSVKSICALVSVIKWSIA